MKKIALILILCLFTSSFSPSFAAVSTTVLSDANSIKVSGTSDDDNIMLYLLRPQKTVEDLEAAFISGNLRDTVAHYRQLDVLDGKYEYTIFMSDTDEKGEYLLCVGDESPVIVYYAPKEYRLALAIQTAAAQNPSMTYEIINENKQYFGINLTLYDAISNKSLVGDLTYKQLEGIDLDESDEESLKTVVEKINQSIMISALNEGLISNIQDIDISTDSTELNNILEMMNKITPDGKSVLLKSLSNQDFKSYTTFVDTLKAQIVLQAINYPVENSTEFLLSVLTQYYDSLALDLSRFNSLTASKKATAVNKLSESKSTLNNVSETLDEIVYSLLSASSGGTSSSPKSSTASSGMKVRVSDEEKEQEALVPDGFSDLSEYEWATEAIEFLAKKSVISGYSRSEFMPANNISRAEFTTIVVRALYDVSSEYEQVFDDVTAENWAFAYIMCAYENGIVSGVDGSHFSPDSSITREDMATILYNIIGVNDNSTVEENDMFGDDTEISNYAKAAVYGLKSYGIINGLDDSTFAPKALAKRAEAAQLIYNFLSSEFTKTTTTKQSTEEKENASALSKLDNALNLLISIGIIDGTFDFNYSAEIKKGNFAMIAANIMGMPEGYKATGEVFDDVSLTNEYAPGIEFLAQLGVFGNEQEFYPNESITLSEAVRIILRVTGYSNFAEEVGGYPNGYYAIALRKDLLSDVEGSYNNILIGSDLISLVFNTLKLNIVDFKGSQTYEENTALTILENRYDVFSHEGIIVANSLTTFYSESDLQDNNIQLNSGGKYININSGITDISNRIGEYVTVYYRYDDRLKSSVCLYYENDSTINDIVTLKIDDVDAIFDSLISYYDQDDKEGEKKTELNLDQNKAVIYNGTYYPEKSITKEFLDNKNGEISIVDNNGDGKYDVLRILAYETYIVNNVLSKTGVFYDKYDSTISVNVEEKSYEEYSLIFADGTKAVIEDLVSGTVVSVAANDERCAERVIKMIVSDDKISGVITEIENKDEKTTITLDNSDKYEVFRKAESSLPGVGKGIVAHLDAFSNIVYIGNNNAGVFNYGLVIATDQGNGMSGKVSMKIFGSGSETKIYPLISQAIIDGVKCNNYDEAYTKMSQVPIYTVGSSSLPSGVFPVRYKLNYDNEIFELDTPNLGIGEGVNSFTYITSGTAVFGSDAVLGYTIPTDVSTVRIDIKTANLSDKTFIDNDNYLTYSSASLMSKGTSYHYAAFKVDSASLYAGFLITYNGFGMSYNHEFLMVNRVFKAYDETTDAVLNCVEGIINGSMRKIMVSPKYEDEFERLNLVQGDVIRYDTDFYKQLIYVDGSVGIVKYNKENKTVTLNNISKGQTSLSNVKAADYSTHIFHGYVKSREEGLIEYVYSTGGSTKTIDIRPNDIDWNDKTNILYSRINSSTPVTVYDSSENGANRVYAGTYDDIADYVHNGNAYSRVLLRYRSGELREIVVFNDASLIE